METIQNNIIDINTFLFFRDDEKLQELDSKTNEIISNLFGNIIRKNKKTKKHVNILKNHKIQQKKESIVNRVNLILNKLSESNINSLALDFFENINQIDQECFNDVQKTFYIKILSEINFVKIYLQLLKIIGCVYNKVYNYDLSFFYTIIEAKFKSDYLEEPTDGSTILMSDLEINGETKRLNNLTLIKNLVEMKFLNQKIIDECDSNIINHDNYLTDIYYWYNNKNRALTETEISKINFRLNLLNKDSKSNLSQREKVLLESLVNKTVQSSVTGQPKVNTAIDVDTLKLESDNIIDEYLLMKSIEDLKYFMDSRCKDAISKNKFCEQLFDKYFSSNTETASDIIVMLKTIMKEQLVFKMNVSRGLLNIHNNWEDKVIDYQKPKDKLTYILSVLKTCGVKGLETIE